MKKAILLKPATEVEVVDFVDELDYYYEKLNCRCIDIVRVYDFLMIVDDEGLLVDDPQLNVFASLLYGGYRICGNVLVVKEEFDEENGPVCVGLSEKDFDEFNSLMTKLIDELYNRK